MQQNTDESKKTSRIEVGKKPAGSNGIDTKNLLDDLKDNKSLTEFFKENKEVFADMSIGEYIAAEIERRNITKSKVIRSSGINKRFFFDILNGKKSPSRRYIIRIFLALQMDFNDVQWYLKATDYPQLYAKNKRDAVIIYCFAHHLSVKECNKMLNNIGLENLGFENHDEE